MFEYDRPEDNLIAFPAIRPPRQDPDLHDLRFRTLLGASAWARLPDAVQRRFSKRLNRGGTVVYVGEVVECRMSRLGWLLAQGLRLIGAPLPLGSDTWVPAIVTVTEDEATGGQNWTRLYGRRRGFPQAIRSSKRFAGPTGLEEYLGFGFGIALVVNADERALHFRSDHLFFAAWGRRLRLPSFLSPGTLTISHVDCGHGDFAFVLELGHRCFGTLLNQTCMFRERAESA